MRDPEVVSILEQGRLPQGWRERAMYLGEDGAGAWLSFASDPVCGQRASADYLQLIHRALAGAGRSSIVSLGPGDGELDREVIELLLGADHEIEYVPVDLSEQLLSRSLALIRPIVPNPTAILGDFEAGFDFIADEIGRSCRLPLLYSMLGGTFGNLDRLENAFLDALAARMSNMDRLLVDVSIARAHTSELIAREEDRSAWGPGWREFIATGIRHRTGEAVCSSLESLDGRIVFRPGQSDVPNTAAVTTCDSYHEIELGTVRHYDWRSLLAWVGERRDFEIAFAQSFDPGDELRSEGILLLERA